MMKTCDNYDIATQLGDGKSNLKILKAKIRGFMKDMKHGERFRWAFLGAYMDSI